MRTLLSISIFLAGLAVGFFVLTNVMQNSSIQKTVVSTGTNILFSGEPQPTERQKVLGWIPYWDQERGFRTVTTYPEAFDYISLFWYYLSENGEVVKYSPAREDRSIITFAHANGIKALMLVANLPDTGGGDWDSERVDRVIATKESRTRHIEDLVMLMDRYNFDGINIDYEALEAHQKERFSLFIKELSEVLHRKGKLVAVALHPKTAEGKPSESNGSQGQDWKELGTYADQLHVMTYEQHNRSTAPGPSADHDWNKRVVAYAKRLIPQEKIFLGIGLYGYAWPEDDDEEIQGLTNIQVDQIISYEGPLVERDVSSGEAHFVYADEDALEWTVWYNDKESVRGRLHFAQEENIGGVAFWRLGGEDEEVWSLFIR